MARDVVVVVVVVIDLWPRSYSSYGDGVSGNDNTPFHSLSPSPFTPPFPPFAFFLFYPLGGNLFFTSSFFFWLVARLVDLNI